MEEKRRGGRKPLAEGEKGKYTITHAVQNRRRLACSFENVAKRKIIMSRARGVSLVDSCKIAGVSLYMYRRWYNESIEFRTKVDNCDEATIEILLQKLKDDTMERDDSLLDSKKYSDWVNEKKLRTQASIVEITIKNDEKKLRQQFKLAQQSKNPNDDMDVDI
jgi:hypothetical protein